MAKSDLDLNKVSLLRTRFKPSKPAWVGDRPIHGWDTETTAGKPFLLTVAWQHEAPEGRAIHDGGKPLDPELIFKYLTHREARGSVNVWFNLDFDANVILALLPFDNLAELTVTNETEWEGYRITYIPRKMLTIRDKHGHKYQHFNVSFPNCGFGSLENTCQEWIGEGKYGDNLDRSRFDDPKYISDNWDDILNYGIRDAVILRRFWVEFVKVAEPLGVPCARPYSTGYLAEQCYNVKWREPNRRKPGFSVRHMQAQAWESYRGGRFEILERGSIGEVIAVDINSAYPYQLKNLPDPSTLRWRRHKLPSWDRLKAADYGFVTAVVWTNENRPLQPFAVKENGKLIFPILEGVRVTVTLPEFIFAVENNLVTNFQTDTAWLATTGPKTVFPFDWVQELYDKRLEFKAAGDNRKQMVLKIILNSLYGKLAQLTETVNSAEGGEEIKDDWFFYPVEILPEALRNHYYQNMEILYRQVKAGSYFNPFLASYITGRTRLALLKATISTGLENAAIILATDSVTYRKAEFDRSSFRRDFLHDSKYLGSWEIEGEGNLFVAGCGVYELEDSDGEIKSRTRGFEPSFGIYGMDLEGGSLKAAAEHAEKEIIPISNNRPLKIAQALWQGYDLNTVGVFQDFPRGLNAGMDTKRNWQREKVTWRDLLTSSETSLPLRVKS